MTMRGARPTSEVREIQMTRYLPTLSTQLLSRLRRVFWLFMFVGHAPGLVRAIWLPGQDQLTFSPVAAIGLSLACTLFLLKILDVRWLRFRTDRSCVCALVLTVAMAHLNLLRFATEARTEFPQPLVVSNILLSSNLITARRFLKRALDWAGRLASATHPAQLICLDVLTTCPRVNPARFRSPSRSPRAPPNPAQQAAQPC